MGDEGGEVLSILNEEVEDWREEQGVRDGEMHVFLGDSNGPGLVDAGLDVSPPDIIINRTESGKKWTSLSIIVRRDINWWQLAAQSFGCTMGVAVIWLSGNDSYPHPKRPLEPLIGLDALEAHILLVLRTLRDVARRVIIVGPIPRFRFDRGLPWERTPAYQAERLIVKMLQRENLTPSFAEVCCVGRYFSVRVRSRRVVGDKCAQLFADDGIHLSSAGYRLVLSKLPRWLQPDAGA
ncbi:hypothetical protein FJT64_021867 [Amphibalanus amphitrite]|uniref:SGNH hydrolase-type esterase domain-containing protein n=1 Tax=Amphibalanus amphitrite TaxID=1232801 RepID=A0A6A4WGY0_AMPAM|nr:uncharacterized protein LOC122372304 [Amphibalanus amphitrite]KAF0306686.1 hypothetical protein FJT64_021867 [Amphibalanus amphitrite]